VLSLVRAPGGNPALDAFEGYAREAFGLAAAAPADPS
jgi:hypothetical protein